jgi:hypothetical protein
MIKRIQVRFATRWALVLGITVLIGSASTSTWAASSLLCAGRSSSENEYVEQRLGSDCLLVASDGALVTQQLFQQVGGNIVANRFAFKRNELWGYADADGRMLAQPQYTIAEPFVEERAMVCREEVNDDRVCGFLGAGGVPVFPLVKNYIFRSYQGRMSLAIPNTSNSNGYAAYVIDRQGIRHPPGVSPGNLCAQWANHIQAPRSMFDPPESGRPIPPSANQQNPLGVCKDVLTQRSMEPADASTVFEVLLGGKVGVNHVYPLSEGFTLVDTSTSDAPSSWGIVGSGPRLVFGPISYSQRGFRESVIRQGLLPVKLPTDENLNSVDAPSNTRFMTPDGLFPLPGSFDDAHGFREGLAAVRSLQNHLWGFIDHHGVWVIPPTYAAVVNDFSSARAVVALAGPNDSNHELLIDMKGRVVARYDELLAANFSDLRLSEQLASLDIESCALKHASYLSPGERRAEMAKKIGIWSNICSDDHLRPLTLKLELRMHQSLRENQSIMKWMASIVAFEKQFLTSCGPDRACLQEKLEDALQDPNWNPSTVSGIPAQQQTAEAEVPATVQQALRRLVAKSKNYFTPEDQDLGDGWGAPILEFQYFRLGAGIPPGILVSQSVTRSTHHWVFKPTGRHMYRQIFETDGNIDHVPGTYENGYDILRVASTDGQGIAIADMRFDGRRFVEEADCSITTNGEVGPDLHDVVYDCSACN